MKYNSVRLLLLIPLVLQISEDTTGLWWEGARKLEEQFAGLDMTLACSRKGPTIFPAVQQGVQTLSQLYGGPSPSLRSSS